jgi:hypothetical protein
LLTHTHVTMNNGDQNRDSGHGVIMGWPHVKYTPIYTANHISLSQPNVCTYDVDEIVSLAQVSPAEISIYTYILAMK